MESINERYMMLADKLVKHLLKFFGDRLVSVIVYGSVGRGEASEESDIDLLVVVRDLPKSRFERQRIFSRIEEEIGRDSAKFSPILKTPEEASRITPLYLDLVEDSIILYDRDDFMKKVLDRLRRRLEELGARRIWRGKSWYWILKPDLKFGEVLEIE